MLYESHQRIVEYVGKNKRVLDVGCGGGEVGAALKHMGCYVVGIEKNPELAERASKVLDRVLVGDVENDELLEQVSDTFDVIVFGDVLEHLIDPEAVLRKIRDYLRDGGFVVVSVPNIGYWRARGKILLGKFEYSDSGVFDRTHLRFFTYDSAKRMIESCGFKVVEESYTRQPWGWKGFVDSILLRISKRWGAFQFVFKAVKV